MKHQLKMPDLSTTSSPIKIVRWLIEVGWPVERGQPVLEVETDKATMEVEATVSGRLLEQAAGVGTELLAGEVVGIIESEASVTATVTQTESPEESTLKTYSPQFLQSLYERMVLIRQFEERVKLLFLEGAMPGTIHQCQGQEACAVGVCAALSADDLITSTFRGHGHALAKGLSVREMMDELFGAITGCCKGKGGSMHMGSAEHGMVPAIAIVAGGIPIAAGMGLAFKMRRTGQVVASFFGDGAVAEGAFHEGLNLAAIWDLPVLFVCENNLYGASTRIDRVMRNTRIADRASSYGLRSDTVDGNNVLGVYEAAAGAVEECRSGRGPVLLELLTYRRTGHSRRDPCAYQSKEERDAWAQRDPITQFADALLQKRIADPAKLTAIRHRIDQDIEAAVELARSAPLPKHAELLTDVYA
jgi:TPP-dependent pyruvate/acetoin dehydrogenase alpha subunit